MPPHQATDRQRMLMVETQLAARDIADPRVLAAMRTVPRHEFVPAADQPAAYQDRPLPIGYGQTISQPYMVALMCELLAAEPHHRVLEVGAGSGYQAAVLGHLAGEVYAIEIVPELVARARAVLSRLDYTNVHVLEGDGSLGHPAAAPFDRIIVAAAAPTVPPPLVEQLTEGGRLVAPVGDRGLQTCIVGTRQQGTLRLHQSISCHFVPLVGAHGWQPGGLT